MPKPSPYTCSTCGYTLTGLGRVGSCPECGSVFNTTSGRGVEIRPHEMHLVADRAKAMWGLGFHSMAVFLFWGAELYLVTSFQLGQFPFWLHLLLPMVGLNSLINVFEYRRKLLKLKRPI